MTSDEPKMSVFLSFTLANPVAENVQCTDN